MTTESAVRDPWVIDQRWDLTYQHTADDVTAHFLRTLRDEGRLLGITCPVCKRVLAPARPICDHDFCRTEGWVELELRGTLELFTIMFLEIQGLPKPPYVLAYVRPNGADTAIAGFLEGVDLTDVDAAVAQLRVGRPVEIALRSERVGRMTDVFFRLTEE